MNDFEYSDNFDTLSELDRNIDRELLLHDLSQTDPLNDRAFQILLQDDIIFHKLLQLITNDEFKNKTLYAFGNVIIHTVDGKKIEVDLIRKNEEGIYNIEAQNLTKEFSFKRHLFYWSHIFSYQLRSGSHYNDLCPVVVIVIYKDNKSDTVIQKGTLTGDILNSGNYNENKNLLRLFSVNAGKWEVADSKDLKCFLALISNGVYNEENVHKFNGIDTSSKFFIELNDSMYYACTRYNYEHAKEKGDERRILMYKTIVSEEELKKREIKGEIKGKIKGKVELLYYSLNYSVEDISILLNLPIEDVHKILSEVDSHV